MQAALPGLSQRPGEGGAQGCQGAVRCGGATGARDHQHPAYGQRRVQVGFWPNFTYVYLLQSIN